MSRRDELDQELGELLRDAVSDVEPQDRLGELRARTSSPAHRRPALLALGGAVLASAAVVTAVAVAGPDLLGPDEPGPATTPTSAPAPTADPESPSSAPSGPPVATRAVAGYYLSDTPAGVRLSREFASTDAPDDGPDASVELLTTSPRDPDYRTLWPEGAFAGVEVGEDSITVDLADQSLVERPGSMTEEEAEASLQQVAYTLQAYARQRLPVVFTSGGDPLDRVLGIPIDGPLTADAQLEVLALVNLTSPAEGEPVSGTVRVEGVANSFEATVPWRLENSAGETVDQGFFTAEGSMGTRLFPFLGPIDVSALAPGSYDLVVEAADPSGGTEGPGAFSDTRTVVVE